MNIEITTLSLKEALNLLGRSKARSLKNNAENKLNNAGDAAITPLVKAVLLTEAPTKIRD
jgi:hypothetical protein